MTLTAVVQNGRIELPSGTTIPDGTVVRIEAPIQKRFADLFDLAGTWVGDDADSIIEQIYAARSSAPLRPCLDP